MLQDFWQRGTINADVTQSTFLPDNFDEPSRPEFFADSRRIWSDVRSQGQDLKMKALQHPNNWRGVASFASDWLVIFGSVFLVSHVSLFFIPLALFLIGSRQRALSNLVHDGSHRNLVTSAKWNDRLSDWLAAYPMHESVRQYRKSHGFHHAQLGSLTGDPDAHTHLRYGYNDRQPWRGSFLSLFSSLLFNLGAWKDSFLGSITTLPSKDRLGVVLFWTTALLLTSAISPQFAVALFGLWYASRATTYHTIRLFAEFLDHTGLRPTTVVDFSRSLSAASPWWTWVVHPHSDRFHLLHHLAPNVPHYALRQAHGVFSAASARYGEGHHCDGYFVGGHTAANCWTGKCPGGSG